MSCSGHDGIVDKFVGDEVIGLYFQGISGPGTRRCRHRGRPAGAFAPAAWADPMPRRLGPIPVGAAVHAGQAYVGSTGSERRGQ